MKPIFLVLFTLIIAAASAQEEHAIPKEKWSKDFFISDEFCAVKGLKPGQTNTLMRVWSSDFKNNMMSRVVDIRFYFTSPSEAKDYLDKNIYELSEKGDTVNSNIKIPMAYNLRIFRENASERKLNESIGFKLNMYYFIFTVKNYLAKVFVSGDMELEDATLYAKEAAKRLNAAAK